jgi:spore germination cell wall hydrolase CwlJ-like protein
MTTTADQTTAEEFILALCIYRESAGEPDEGKLAVGCTVRNRVQHPKWWGNDYYSVITARWQYSSITAPGDPTLIKYPKWVDPTFQKCITVARLVIDGTAEHPFPGADSYYSDVIAAPKWATMDKFVGQIGHHIFFNCDGDFETTPTTK